LEARDYSEVTYASAYLSEDKFRHLLRTVGLARPDGEIYANQLGKFQETLALSEHLAIMLSRISRRRSATLLDCACGKGYVAFVLNYLTIHEEARLTHFIGVDRSLQLIQKCKKTQRTLCLDNMSFHTSSIIEFASDMKPDIVYCLHACDTATDEAIAKGILLNSRFIAVVPCCQREVNRKIKAHPLKLISQFPTLKERLGSLVTDTLRALVLTAAGYKVEVFEFVSSKVTPKNLMLRAEKIWPENLDALKQYRQLRNMFNVEPMIEEYLPWLRSEQ